MVDERQEQRKANAERYDEALGLVFSIRRREILQPNSSAAIVLRSRKYIFVPTSVGSVQARFFLENLGTDRQVSGTHASSCAVLARDRMHSREFLRFRESHCD